MKVFEFELEIPDDVTIDTEPISSFKTDDINEGNYITIIPRICEIVELIPKLNGEQKKKLSLVFFKYIVKEKLNWKDEDIESRASLVDSMIEITIMITKGKFNINRVIGCFKKFLRVFCNK